MDKMMESLARIIAANVERRVNGRVHSERSITAANEALKSNFRILHTKGWKLENASNLADRHIHVLCEEWLARGLAPKTMQGYLSQLRIFCSWIGKKGMVKRIDHYLPHVPKDKLRVNNVAVESKGWAEHDIDVDAKVREAMAIDWRFGCMILAMIAFGLRRYEALTMIPWKADLGDRFWVVRGKNGRTRDIAIETPVQRAILDFIKSKVTSKTDCLGWTERHDGKPTQKGGMLKYSESRYNNLMAKIGITKEVSEVTGHGLRAQFAENAALLRSFIPPTLGGTGGQLPREELNLLRGDVSAKLGHSRISITNPYYGSFGREGKVDEPGRTAHNINSCLAVLLAYELKPVLRERIIMCSQLVIELATIDVYCNLREVQMLWEHHSKRYSTDWLELDLDKLSPIAALEAAALSVMHRKVDDSSKAD